MCRLLQESEGAVMADIKWVKVSTDIWNNKKIKQIESLKNGDTYIVIWMKLLTLAGQINDNGYIYVTEKIPFTDKGLAVELNKPLKVVKDAIELFEEYEMIEIEDGYIILTGWEKYQNIEGMEKIREQTKDRVKRYREKKRNAESNVTSNADVTQGNATEEEIDIEIEKEKESVREKEALTLPLSVDDLYEFLPRAKMILQNMGMDLSFPVEEIEPFIARNTQYKWKGITDAESLAMAMWIWMQRADEYRLNKEMWE